MIEIMNAMSLKAKIRNIAKENGISAQVVLQNYFFERFLYRLSKSSYCENFIIKGGLLIAAMAGINTRSTMDLDATIRSLTLDEKHIREAINTICDINVNDDIIFNLTGVEQIREDNEYGGFRVHLNAIYEKINSPLSVDITAGDVITPNPIKRKFNFLFDNTNQFELWTYTVETILAEKVETILRRGESSTRPRDLYDVYLISKTQKYNAKVFNEALISTSANRGTAEIIKDTHGILNAIKKSSILKKQWDKYKREYSYAKEITFEEVVKTLTVILT